MQLDTSQLHVGEIELRQWQYKGDLGHFKNYLWKAICNADNNHLKRLSAGFPEQIDAYRKFIGEDGYWQSVLVRSGLVKPPPAQNDPKPEQPPVIDPKTPYDH